LRDKRVFKPFRYKFLRSLRATENQIEKTGEPNPIKRPPTKATIKRPPTPEVIKSPFSCLVKDVNNEEITITRPSSHDAPEYKFTIREITAKFATQKAFYTLLITTLGLK
jgi:hypothetical protein